MSTKKIKIGVIGAAQIALKSIVPAILELDEFEFIGIASRDQAKQLLLAEQFKTITFESYDQLINYSELDAVYIPLPNAMHFEWVKKSLENGLHVLVEKSLSCSLSEVQALNRLAQSKGLALVENFQFRFHSQLRYIKNIIEDNVLGELRCIRSSFGFPPFSDSENIRYKKELGGGSLLDAGAYPIRITQELLGNNIEVAASSLSIDTKRGVDIYGGAFIKQIQGDLFSEIAFGFDNFYQCSLEIWGSKGKLSTNRIFTAPIGYAPEVLLEVGKDSQVIKLESDNHFRNMLLHFHELCCKDDTSQKKNIEYKQNENQARLIDELKSKANG